MKKAAIQLILWALTSVPFLIQLNGVAESRAKLPEPPNVVLIYMDDMAWADIGAFGATDYPTPNLDQLAREGRIFTDFYVTQAVCSASRAGLMTGCYSNRVGISGALGPGSKTGIHEQEMTLAELFKQKGYATACYGKWHLGHQHEFLPMQHGFDDYFGLPYSNDMWPWHPEISHRPMEERIKIWPHLPLIDKNEIVNPQVTPEIQEQLTTLYTRKSIEFIENNHEKPFFLYLPHSMVHVPLFVSDKFKNKSGAGLFGDVMMEVDWSVGEVIQCLKKYKLETKTLVIFTSDNGPWLSYGDHAGSAGPLREGKGTMFEGGCREPTIMWWPGVIPASTVCQEPAMTIDILPTLAHLIDAPLPPHRIDGKNIWPLIQGIPGSRTPQDAYFFYYDNGLHAMRMGPWKLHFPHSYRTLNGQAGGKDGMPAPYFQARTDLALYNLELDISESKDLKSIYPNIIKTMQSLADEMRQDLGDSFLQIKGMGVRNPGKI